MMNLSNKWFTVSELTRLIKQQLEQQFPRIQIEGEISNFRPSSTGHWYFTLKDEGAVIQAVMFRGRASHNQFLPYDGQLVRVRGNISVYAKSGNYQIICESMTKAGEGAILAMLEERKKKLAEEGLFDSERKKSLPMLPSKIAVITSPTGAAVRDILNVINRRNSKLNVVILPAPVQGSEAAGIIAQQIRTANMHKLGEVLIIGRGGGSLEDLLPFSEEEVVRAVADSEIPVISAVGHEIDTALSDYAADLRAPTPSAAAELVTADREEIESRVSRATEGIIYYLKNRLKQIRTLLVQFSPEKLDHSFRTYFQPILQRVDDAKELLLRDFKDRIIREKHRLELAQKELEANSPLAILEKGFAVVTKTADGSIVTRSNQVQKEEQLSIRVAKGKIISSVEDVEE